MPRRRNKNKARRVRTSPVFLLPTSIGISADQCRRAASVAAQLSVEAGSLVSILPMRESPGLIPKYWSIRRISGRGRIVENIGEELLSLSQRRSSPRKATGAGRRATLPRDRP